ncbi:MAG: epoxyqueuosine reductase [Candidatus Heimdallarchaeota archaeon]|nr:MAG: epoxyqueuosine reductase [Candidatus Heimdallarchaeota archaeon]
MMISEFITSEEIRLCLESRDAALAGIADTSYLNETFGFSKKELKKYPRAISIGIQLSDEIIDNIREGPTEEYAEHYRDVNMKLDYLAEFLAERLREKDFLALPIPASKRYDRKKLAAEFPHKTAAILCGLGWIGKSALLISYELGPRVRFSTVLTNAPLETGDPQKTSECNNCIICVEACPANAIKGTNWTFGDKREKIFDAHKCKEYLDIQEKRVGETICGICVSVCPYGGKKSRN